MIMEPDKELQRLKALFATEIVISNRKIEEFRGSLSSLVAINAELIKKYEAPKKPKKSVKDDKSE